MDEQAHNTMQAGGRIMKLDPADHPKALEQLAMNGRASDRHQIHRFMQFAKRQAAGPVECWAYRTVDDGLDHVVLLLPRAGRTGMCFVARPDRRGKVEQLAAVIRAATTKLPPERWVMLQALLETTDDLQQAALEQAGFSKLATLDYMQRVIGRSEAAPAPLANVQVMPWHESRRALFVQVLDASYEQTLDCPALRGIRQTDDVLTGHMASGQFDPALWLLVCMRDEPVAVLLLTEVPEQECVELVYLGVGVKYRQRGIARHLLQHAFHLTAARDRRLLTLAVDETNEPAMQLYRHAGFRRFARRLAMALVVQPTTGDK